jgi:hypothetical protein
MTSVTRINKRDFIEHLFTIRLASVFGLKPNLIKLARCMRFSSLNDVD